jgi:hypothetical protein
MSKQFEQLITQVRKHVPVPEEIIQDAQVSAGQARYVEAVNDCIKIAEDSSARYLVAKFEELKAKFLESV